MPRGRTRGQNFRGMELALNNAGLIVVTHALGRRGTDYKNAAPIAFV